MAKYPPRPDQFTCAICGKQAVSDGYLPPNHYPIAPLCRVCESGGYWSRGYSYGYRYTPQVTPDRRILSQLRALSDQLHDEAARHVRT